MKQQINLYVIYVISFMDLFAVGLMFPLLQPHLRSLGISHTSIGIMGSVYSALQVLAGPLIGSWSDIRGRKSVILVTLTICAFCYALLGLSSTVISIFLLRISLGIVKHTQTLCKAMISDLLPKEKHAEAYGQSSGFGMLGFVVGPAIGGHISHLDNGFFYVCCLTSSLFIVNTILSFMIPNAHKTVNEKKTTIEFLRTIDNEVMKAWQELKRINWNEYWDTFVLRFLFGLTVSVFHTSQALYLKEKHNLPQIIVGYTISFFSIVGVICSLCNGWIERKFFKDDNTCLKRIFNSFLTISLCTIGFYITSNLTVFYILLIPFSIASTILRVVTMQMMLQKSRREEKGSLSGASNSVMSVARLISPLSTGIVGDIFGEEYVMFLSFFPALLGAIISFRLFSFVKYKTN